MNPQDTPLQEKTSFYFPMLLLPRDQREALEVLYRFCWLADEISDGPGSLPVKKQKLSACKKELKACLAGRSRDPLFQKLQAVILQYKMSPEPLWRIISGVERDLKPIHFKTFGELHDYALKVAGGPGLASMEIFGFKDEAHRVYAENLGVFLQLVNMTRDYREDMALNRQYFPSEDFKRFHLIPGSIEEKDSHWVPFVEFQLERAWSYLKIARQSLSLRQRSELTTAEAISAVYFKLGQKLWNNPRAILRGKTSLSKADKLLSVVGAWLRCLSWRYASK